ncbi:hypothetical protein VTK26DRAFT_6352 [Humicola hyalothermophila]
MLLYTRLAPPKQPKRRSRGGCTYCKEKKKKCDEARPKCSRCTEHGVDCFYDAVKPRQRRRRESAPGAAPRSPSTPYTIARRLSAASQYSHGDDYAARRDQSPYYFGDPFVLSPSEGNFDRLSVPAFSATQFLDDQEVDHASENCHSPTSSAATSTAVLSQPKSLHPDLAMIAPCPVGSPLLDFVSPSFSEFSDRQNRRALLDHFCNVLSHLIVFREESGNPFQQLVLPLTRSDSPVTYAIFALACAHLEYRGVENAEKSLHFHNMAIRGVAKLIEHNREVNRNEILAAIMLLVYYECLVQKGRSNIVAGHLKGALTVMGTIPDPSDSTSVFLERAFRFYDVITALSNGTAPLSEAPTPGCLLPISPLGAPSASPLCNVDTLLGMATTLWPIIHRLAGLRALKTQLTAAVKSNESPSKVAVLRTEFESTAQAIETALLRWQPQLPSGFILPDEVETDSTGELPVEIPHDHGHNAPIPDNTEDIFTATATAPITVTSPPPTPSPPSSANPSPDHAHRLASIHHNALAYRHASLVYLYRVVLGHPRASPATVQAHTRRTLRHCVETVSHGGPMSALLWPLFVAACEAVTEEDRELARTAFEKVDKRQGMRNIGRAWEIVGEVWRRGDERERRGGGGVEEEGEEDEEEELWRRVSREMGVNIVFG